jgi:aminoglycoside phosphotransferase
MGRKQCDVEADAERFEIQPLDGYPSITSFISSDHDRTTLVFKRFDDLAIRNLLYLQSELAELKERQEEFDEEDRSIHADLEMKACAMSWSKSQALAKAGDLKQKERVNLAMEIRSKINEYSKFI